MQEYPRYLNKFLEFEVLSSGALRKLLENNGITNVCRDEYFKPHLEMLPNLTMDDHSKSVMSGYYVPSYITPVEGRPYLSEKESRLFAEVLGIQKMASQDEVAKAAINSNIVFRKVAMGVAMLEDLQRDCPELSEPEYHSTKYFIEHLIRDGKRKIENINVVWEGQSTSQKPNYGSTQKSNYGSMPLVELKGGRELLDRALALVVNYGIFELIQQCIDGKNTRFNIFCDQEDRRHAEANKKANRRRRRGGARTEPKPSGMVRPSEPVRRLLGSYEEDSTDSGRVYNEKPRRIPGVVTPFVPVIHQAKMIPVEEPTPPPKAACTSEKALLAQRLMAGEPLDQAEKDILLDAIRKLSVISEKQAKLGTTLNQWMFLENGKLNLPYILEHNLSVTDVQKKQLKGMVVPPAAKVVQTR